ncbi:MAG: GNAT family N-acetyltransferase [Candidatus Paceibacterota bacterium]
MILSFSTIQLRRIDFNDIELLRHWRNDQKIVQFMFYKKHISKEMQRKWFLSLNETDFYFIIEYQNKPLGLINLADEQIAEQAAFAGLFIYDESYWGTQVPVLASLCLLRFAFEDRKLESVYAKIQKSNVHAKIYNRNLGFRDFDQELQRIDKASYKDIVQPLLRRIERRM